MTSDFIRGAEIDIVVYNGDVSELRNIAAYWRDECNSNEMNIKTSMDSFLVDLKELIDGDNSDLLVLVDDVPIGLLGLTTFTSPISSQLIANEHYWYVIPPRRGIASMRLLKAAEDWAKEKGCSHLIMTASNLASDLHDTVCFIYEKMGMKKFETSYIRGV